MKISLDKIVCESNRKYTKDEGFEQFLNSVKQYGILEPPLLREMQDGRYKTIAGRRRIAAARQLGYTEVDCVVREQDDPIDDEEIALTENVNRLDMHPLDEAAAFKRMADEGNPIEEIARYYARSPSAIYKRLRLVPLIEELKGWFRDEILGISGAALLAELPEEDQKKFYDLYKERYGGLSPEEIEDGEKYSEIDNRAISQFVYKQQRNKICECLGNECGTCAKRTHNSDNDLFEEFSYMDDVCLDGDCYRAKWQKAISLALAEKYAEYGPNRPDCKIRFHSNFLDAVPDQLYKKATHAIFNPGGGDIRFEILKEKDWEFTGETSRKNGACYEIGEDWNEGTIKVRRIGYKERQKEEKAASRNEAGSGIGKGDDKQYGLEVLKAVAEERGTSSTELVKNLSGKKTSSYDFKEKIGELVYERVVARRIEKEKNGTVPCTNYCSLFLRIADEEGIGNYSFIEKNFNNKQKKWWSVLYGKEPLTSVLIDLPDEVQTFFHFLLLSLGLENWVPDLDELKNIKKEKGNMFWEYARMEEKEYRALYIQAAKDVIAKVLPEPKKAGKAAAPHVEDVPADASGAGSSSSKKGKRGAKKSEESDVPKCRICGCTETAPGNPRYLVGKDICNVCEDELNGIRRCRKCGCTEGTPCINKYGETCHWVGIDLCSACADGEIEDNYPFELDDEDEGNPDVDMSDDEDEDVA
jgi:ParB family chromosome partitioning protein